MRDTGLLRAAMTIGERIRKYREAEGRSQAWLADRLGVSQNTVSGWETGRAQPSRHWAQQIARTLGVDIARLELERVERVTHKVRLMGYVGPDHTIEPAGDGELVEVIGAPPDMPGDAEAAIVRGDSMYPLLRDGFVVVWWGWTTDPSQWIGELCACRRSDGSVSLKIVEAGSRAGVWTLASLSSAPQRDVQLDAVAPIEVINRRRTTPPESWR